MTVDNEELVTPATRVLPVGDHVVSAPESVDGLPFSRWSTGERETTAVVHLDRDTLLVATYGSVPFYKRFLPEEARGTENVFMFWGGLVSLIAASERKSGALERKEVSVEVDSFP